MNYIECSTPTTTPFVLVATSFSYVAEPLLNPLKTANYMTVQTLACKSALICCTLEIYMGYALPKRESLPLEQHRITVVAFLESCINLTKISGFS